MENEDKSVDKEKSGLEELKEKYLELQKKYNLPEFDSLNRDFHIEKTDVDTDYLIREIRKFISDKLANYLRFLETLMNPSGSPMFVFGIVKKLNSENKEVIAKIHKALAFFEVRLVGLDVEFNEDDEAKYIQDSFEAWQGMKKDLVKILNSIKDNWENNSEGNSKGYFG